MRIDCVQCHDDNLGGDWKQQDFHELAAFFAPSSMTLTGVRDKEHLETLALDRATGKILWRVEAPHKTLEKIHGIGNGAERGGVDARRLVVKFLEQGFERIG